MRVEKRVEEGRGRTEYEMFACTPTNLVIHVCLYARMQVQCGRIDWKVIINAWISIILCVNRVLSDLSQKEALLTLFFLSLQSIILKFGQWMPFYGNGRVWSLWNLTVKFKDCFCIGHWFINVSVFVSVSMPHSLLRLVNLNACPVLFDPHWLLASFCIVV